MPTQTSYQQRDILDAAKRLGDYDKLCWYIEVEFPKKMIPAGIRRRQPAQWPHGCIPVLPVGDDAEESRAWAEMLAGLFEWDNRGRVRVLDVGGEVDRTILTVIRGDVDRYEAMGIE